MPCHAMHPIQDLFLKESFGDRKYLGTYLNTNKKSIQFKINEHFKFLARKNGSHSEMRISGCDT
jgi:hypothetical protein